MRGIDGKFIIWIVKCSSAENQYKVNSIMAQEPVQPPPPPPRTSLLEGDQQRAAAPPSPHSSRRNSWYGDQRARRGKKHSAAHPMKRDTSARHIPARQHKSSG